MRSRSLLFLGAALLLSAQMFASLVVVSNSGSPNCRPGLPRYNTIQDAVNFAPSGSTIDVCPGTYPEQVTIPDSLTLVGVSATNQGAAVITAPAGGMQASNVVDVYGGVPIAAQILVNSAGPVTINNITVDGSNNGITSCTPELVGILYQNSSGTVTHTNVLNENAPPANGCQSGQGIYVQSANGGSSLVSITNNHVENYQKNGIVARQPGSVATIGGNTVIGQGVTSGDAENSIEIAFGATGSVTGNTVGSDEYSDPSTATGTGILIYQSSKVTISKNNVSNTQTGVGVYSVSLGDADFATITGNTISATHALDGIDACSSNNTITGNTVNGSDQSGIHLDTVCTGASTGNTVSSNTINGACAGVLSGPGAGTVGSNKYYNAATLVLVGSDTCTRALGPQHSKTKAAALSVKP